MNYNVQFDQHVKFAFLIFYAAFFNLKSHQTLRFLSSSVCELLSVPFSLSRSDSYPKSMANQRNPMTSEQAEVDLAEEEAVLPTKKLVNRFRSIAKHCKLLIDFQQHHIHKKNQY